MWLAMCSHEISFYSFLGKKPKPKQFYDEKEKTNVKMEEKMKLKQGVNKVKNFNEVGDLCLACAILY